MFFEQREKISGESGVAYSSIPITFTLSPFARLRFYPRTVHTQHSFNDRIPTEVLFFLENIKKRVNGFLSIPHLMQRYRDCTKWEKIFLVFLFLDKEKGFFCLMCGIEKLLTGAGWNFICGYFDEDFREWMWILIWYLRLLWFSRVLWGCLEGLDLQDSFQSTACHGWPHVRT